MDVWGGMAKDDELAMVLSAWGSGAEAEDVAGTGVGIGMDAAWWASLRSEKVRRAVRMVISRPLRSLTSKLTQEGKARLLSARRSWGGGEHTYRLML